MSTPASTPKRTRREGVASRQIGRYDVTSALGKGAMGVVYAARDVLLDRPVAIKVMAGTMAGDGDLRRHFEREARPPGGSRTGTSSPSTTSATTDAARPSS